MYSLEDVKAPANVQTECTMYNKFTFFCLGGLFGKSEKSNLQLKNPAYGRHQISRPMQIVAPPPKSFSAFFFTRLKTVETVEKG